VGTVLKIVVGTKGDLADQRYVQSPSLSVCFGVRLGGICVQHKSPNRVSISTPAEK
jgi:hypothetical protein